MRHFLSLALVFAWFARADGPADNVADKVRPVPPAGAAIPDEVRQELLARVETLRKDLNSARAELGNKSAAIALLPDIEIFHKAVDWAVRYNEIFNASNEIALARQLLNTGSQRLEQLRAGQPQWISATGLVVRGYVSRLDGSVQPYGLVVPAGYQPGARPSRLDVWFHGRDEKLTELNFLGARQKSPGEFTPRNTLVLHTYGRYCNGQKLAGEVDLFEALADVQRNYSIDDQRIIVRGFSLGGAACWHIAAHYPTRWAAAAPGAGFSETPEFLKVFQNEAIKPAWYEQKLWHQYNATDYALNIFNLPTVAYSGEIDRQKQAADTMAAAMLAEGMDLTHIIGPKTEHRYHPAAREEISRRIDSIAGHGRNPLPPEIRFTTWTLRYNTSGWLTVDAMSNHWERARVIGQLASDNSIRLETENVTALTVTIPSGLCPFDLTRLVRLVIDSSELIGPKTASDRSWSASFHKEGQTWRPGVSTGNGIAKHHLLQGPIDDAFMGSFLVVRPTGHGAVEKIDAWAKSELAHFTNEWRRQFRGDARVKDDKAVTDTDIAEHNLILWGDASSNELIARVAPKLPISWTGSEIKVGTKTFDAATHVPVLIYPNPLNPGRYVVLNSGFTIREYDYLNNARQVPKLPDWAVVDVTTAPSSRWPGKIAEAGFFGERWELR